MNKNWLYILMAVVFLGVNIWYFSNAPAEKLPLIKTEEVTVMEIQSPPGKVLQSITDKQKISGIIRYYNRAAVRRNSFGTNPQKKIELHLYDGRVVGIWPLNSEMVGIGIKDKSGYKQYNVSSPELVDYLNTIPAAK